MTCSNCGKDIPFRGVVCPWCHQTKVGDQVFKIVSFIGCCVAAFVSVEILHLSFGIGVVVFAAIVAPFAFVGWKLKAKAEMRVRKVSAQRQAQQAKLAEEGLQEGARASGEMRECPACAETIKPKAKVCRYCQQQLS